MIPELNDPFELLSIELSNKDLRKAFRDVKEELSKNRGILCFSTQWSNPVQWGHYADRHRGLCLGFEIPDEHLVPVSYSAKRLATEVDQLLTTGAIDESTMLRLLTTKYSHWKYEHEMRCFISLEEKDPETGFYFADFSNDLTLREVIVGARSDVSRADVASALGQPGKSTKVFKARLAFKSFKVVRNKDESLWL